MKQRTIGALPTVIFVGLCGVACTINTADDDVLDEATGGVIGNQATGGSPSGTSGTGGAPATGGGGGASDAGVPEDANPCTGPGPTNPENVSGFPAGPAATLTGGAWDGWAVSYGKLDEAANVDGFETTLHTAAPSEARTSYFHMPASMLGDLTDVAGVSFWLRTESEGGKYYESGYAYRGDVVLKGATETTRSRRSGGDS